MTGFAAAAGVLPAPESGFFCEVGTSLPSLLMAFSASSTGTNLNSSLSPTFKHGHIQRGTYRVLHRGWTWHALTRRLWTEMQISWVEVITANMRQMYAIPGAHGSGKFGSSLGSKGSAISVRPLKSMGALPCRLSSLLSLE